MTLCHPLCFAGFQVRSDWCEQPGESSRKDAGKMPAVRDGRGDRRHGPEKHPLPAQSPSPSLDRGFGPFFALHFHSCVVC